MYQHDPDPFIFARKITLTQNMERWVDIPSRHGLDLHLPQSQTFDRLTLFHMIRVFKDPRMTNLLIIFKLWLTHTVNSVGVFKDPSMC